MDKFIELFIDVFLIGIVCPVVVNVITRYLENKLNKKDK